MVNLLPGRPAALRYAWLIAVCLGSACGEPEPAAALGPVQRGQSAFGVAPALRHAGTLLADIDDAVQWAHSRGLPGLSRLAAQHRVLFVPPSTRFARTGGQRNVTLLTVGAAQLGLDVVSFNPPSDNATFLAAAGVAVVPSHPALFVHETQGPQLRPALQRFDDAWRAWRRAPRSDKARAQALTAYHEASAMLLRGPTDAHARPASAWVPARDALADALWTVGYAQQLREALVTGDVDLCVVDLVEHAVAGVFAVADLPIHLVWYVQNVEEDDNNALVAQHASVIACSHTALEQKFAAGALAKKAYVVPNGIATERFARSRADATLRAQLGLPQDAFVVGQVAAFRAPKGQSTVVEAFASLAQGMPEARLLLIGGEDDPSYTRRVQARIASLGLSGQVLLLSDREDVALLLPLVDVFVSASHTEGFGLSTAEAMAAARPVVLTAIPPSEALAAEDALYFAPDDAPALARHLAALKDPALRHDLGQRAQRRALRTVGNNGTMLARFLQALDDIAQN